MKKNEFGDLNYLSINDLKSIDVFEMKLENGKFIPLYGPNGSGKSTVMDSLMMVFSGGTVPDGSIRDGKDESKIEVQTTNGYKITKRIRKQKSGKKAGAQVSELVMTKDNQPVPKAQTVLKELFAGFVTPNDLAGSEGAALYKKLSAAAGINTANFDKDIEALRFDKNQKEADIRSYKSMAVQPEGDDPGDVEPYDAVEHQNLLERQRELQGAQGRYDEALTLSKKMEQAIKETEARLGQMKKAYNTKISQLYDLNQDVKNNAPLMEELKEKIQNMMFAQKNQEQANAWSKYKEFLRTIEKSESDLEVLKDSLKSSEAKKKNFVESSDTGVPGLTLTAEGDVKYLGHSWKNVCFSDRMKAAAILGLKNLDKEKLPIMFIEHGESLSTEKREEIAKVAIDNGAIVFMEVFTEDTSNIKDGVIMRVSESAPVVVENKPIHETGMDGTLNEEPSHDEVIGAIQEQAKEFDPMSVDLSGDLSKYSKEQLDAALEAQRDHSNDAPPATPEDLGMKKASDVGDDPFAAPSQGSLFGWDDEPESTTEATPESKDDDPWANLGDGIDIF